MGLAFTKATRRSVPLLISISSVSGGGKTYSALLLAAGLAGPSGRVGFIDTENGRGSMYADSPGIMKALPRGYEIAQLDPDFTPARYIEAIQAAENAGINVLVIDSVSHEWEGIGGCVEMAENNKLKGMPNWSLAKREHKKFMNYCLTTSMHLIFCIRAREKVKLVDVIKDNGKKSTEVVPIGLQPIAEKNMVFEMTVSLMLDELTHHARPVKVPEPLVKLFPGGKLITKADGEQVLAWNQTGATFDSIERLQQRAKVAADEGIESYEAFFKALPAAQKKMLADTTHAENKDYARLRSEEIRAQSEAEQQAEREAETAVV